MRNSKRVVSLLWTMILFGFTVYAILDTFVIERAYVFVEEKPMRVKNPMQYTPIHVSAVKTTPAVTASWMTEEDTTPKSNVTPSVNIQPLSSENSYSDENISITIHEVRIYDSTVYVADVLLSSPEHLQTAFANNVYGRNVTAKTSRITKKANAILAINGDYYGARSSGYVIRNNVLYRSKANRNAEDLVIYEDGSFEIVKESQISAQDLLEKGARNVLSFGPALLIDGRITVNESVKTKVSKSSHPRTAIGIIDKLHYLFVVSDGRTKASKGLSLQELAAVMQDFGATTAYNLDGGGSSTMVFQGRIVNNPTSDGKRIKERSISDIVCIIC